jgi:hypothetical protein
MHRPSVQGNQSQRDAGSEKGGEVAPQERIEVGRAVFARVAILICRSWRPSPVTRKIAAAMALALRPQSQTCAFVTCAPRQAGQTYSPIPASFALSAQSRSAAPSSSAWGAGRIRRHR